jgi:hypothetical protein
VPAAFRDWLLASAWVSIHMPTQLSFHRMRAACGGTAVCEEDRQPSRQNIREPQPQLWERK